MTLDLPPAPSKTHQGENFPVASFIIAKRHRPVILAYYRFARGADDVADSPVLSPDAKLGWLDRFEATLLGKNDDIEAARPLRSQLAARKISARHALDLLHAFRMDAIKHRYANWSELMGYCAYSAAPVGRFVLDVHGESEETWPASDALCSALQIINHLQDCAKDYKILNRVYIPLDALAARGLDESALACSRAPAALRLVLRDLLCKNAELVALGSTLPAKVRDFRLCLETAVIAKLARRLDALLLDRDPLSESVHLRKAAVISLSSLGVADGLCTHLRARRIPSMPASSA
ncbi:MAG TPA: squalene synthase HpnC [Methylocella sp.]|nr:squalene synthase HpnC [Methylocella sp.]